MIRRRLRIYVDSSVFGGAFDDEFDTASLAFFEQARGGRFQLISSPVVEREMREAPRNVRRLYDEILAISELQLITDEVESLAQAYLDAGILTERSHTDALHVALATVGACDVLVSWNFRHLVN